MREMVQQQPAIEELATSWHRPALELLLGALPIASRNRAVERILTRFEKEKDLQRGLLGVLLGDHLLAAVWAELQPGRTATIWLPRVTASHQSLGGRLAIAAVDAAFSLDARMAQALISTGDVAERRWFDEAGLRKVAEVECLEWQVASIDSDDLENRSTPTEVDLHWEPYEHPSQRKRLEQLLMQTWIDSSDCPSLEGVRDPADVLDGYIAMGICEADHGRLLCAGNDDIGCLLLAEHPDSDEMELVYMGLVPKWRGSGLGDILVEMAKQETQRAGRNRLTTAVDAANTPARAVYRAAGLICYDWREVLLRVRI